MENLTQERRRLLQEWEERDTSGAAGALGDAICAKSAIGAEGAVGEMFDSSDTDEERSQRDLETRAASLRVAQAIIAFNNIPTDLSEINSSSSSSLTESTNIWKQKLFRHRGPDVFRYDDAFKPPEYDYAFKPPVNSDLLPQPIPDFNYLRPVSNMPTFKNPQTPVGVYMPGHPQIPPIMSSQLQANIYQLASLPPSHQFKRA